MADEEDAQRKFDVLKAEYNILKNINHLVNGKHEFQEIIELLKGIITSNPELINEIDNMVSAIRRGMNLENTKTSIKRNELER